MPGTRDKMSKTNEVLFCPLAAYNLMEDIGNTKIIANLTRAMNQINIH
jgi:hypothetical protein